MASREQVASSFTIIKGAMIGETYSVLAGWDLGRSKRENLDRLRTENYIGASTSTWLRDVAKVLNRRFDPGGRDKPLTVLAQGGMPLDEWKPILLWHMTRDEFLLRDFLQEWLFRAHSTGVFRVRTADVEGYLAEIRGRGAITEHDWSEQTTSRVAAGLLKIASDFGLLRGSVSREFASYHLGERSLLYLLRATLDAEGAPAKAVQAPGWRMFMMSPADVEHELLRLHQFRKLEYQSAGSFVHISMSCPNALACAEEMVA